MTLNTCTIYDSEQDIYIPAVIKNKTIFVIDNEKRVCTNEICWSGWEDLLPIAPFFQNHSNKWGYFHLNSGEVVVDASYDQAYPFYGDRAQVFLNEKYGFVDELGNEITPFIWDDVLGTFHTGICAVKANTKWGFIDKKGLTVLPPQFEEVYPFQLVGTSLIDKMFIARVKKDGKFGFINHSGMYIVPPIFSHALDFSRVGAPVKFDGKWSFIDTTGNLVMPFQFDDVGITCSFLAKDHCIQLEESQIVDIFTVLKDGKWGVVNSLYDVYFPMENDTSVLLKGREIYVNNGVTSII